VLGQTTGNTDSLDSPRPKFGGSHHLPPYSILCDSPRRLHSNFTFSWDSQRGVLKVSWFAFPRLWASINSCSDLRLGGGVKQSYSSLWKFSNAMSHSPCWLPILVNSRLLVVGSQIASLIPGPSFAHNLGCICLNGWCKAILDIYISKISNGIKNTLMRGVLTPAIKLWVFRSPGELQVPIFGSVSFIFTFSPKWGCDKECLLL
jgi:hypothetical protein